MNVAPPFMRTGVSTWLSHRTSNALKIFGHIGTSLHNFSSGHVHMLQTQSLQKIILILVLMGGGWRNKAIYYINGITIGEPVSANALTPTHTQTTQTAWWSLCWKHAGFPRSRGSLPSLQRTTKNAIPTLPLSLSFIAQGGKDVRTRYSLANDNNGEGSK